MIYTPHKKGYHTIVGYRCMALDINEILSNPNPEPQYTMVGLSPVTPILLNNFSISSLFLYNPFSSIKCLKNKFKAPLTCPILKDFLGSGTLPSYLSSLLASITTASSLFSYIFSISYIL